MTEDSLQSVTVDQFSELVGTEFRVASAEGVVQVVVLTSVTPAHVAGGFESFSLFFNGAANCPLVQRTYVFEHDRLGRFHLFIVPVGMEQGRMQYEAVFNRRRDG